MAAIDAVMAEDRARAIVDKYRQRVRDEAGDVTAQPPEWLTEMQSDIAAGINAAIHKVMGEPTPDIRRPDGDGAAKVEATPGGKPEQAPGSAQSPARGGGQSSRNTTHMPGSQGKRG